MSLSKLTMRWSLIPGEVCTWEMSPSLGVGMRSSTLLEAGLVICFCTWARPNSFSTSMKHWWAPEGEELVVNISSQLISGKLKSPAMIMFGSVWTCFLRISAKLSRSFASLVFYFGVTGGGGDNNWQDTWFHSLQTQLFRSRPQILLFPPQQCPP